MAGPEPAPRDDCPRCRGTGWVRAEDDPEAGVARCECTRRIRVERYLEAAEIPPRYRPCTLENFVVEPGFSELDAAHRTCKNYVEGFPRIRYGLLFTGNPGVGKTHLAVAVMRALIERYGISGRFADYRTLLQQIQDSYNPVSQTSELEVLAPVLSADVLLLDELGARRPTDWVRETVAHILNDRYSNQRVTLFTTNYPLRSDDGDSLADRVDERVRSRLYEMCRTIPMEGEDYRERSSKDRSTLRYSAEE